MTSERNGDLSGLHVALVARFGDERVGSNVPLGPFTTFKVGGPADLFVEPRSSDETVDVLRLAATHAVPVTILGGGSNVLVADAGVRGLVVRPRGGHIERLDANRVRADAAVTINGLVRWLVGHGLAGLEAWAGTPGTVGGGIYGNAHWGGRLLSEFIESVRLARLGAAAVFDVPVSEMGFGYDRSRLQTKRRGRALGGVRRPGGQRLTCCARPRERRLRIESEHSRWRRPAPAASFRIPGRP